MVLQAHKSLVSVMVNMKILIEMIFLKLACVPDILITTPKRLVFLLNQDPPAISLNKYVFYNYILSIIRFRHNTIFLILFL